MKASLKPEYFDQVYGNADDPWSFATSDYEREKYAATMDALPRECYANGFEIGCSIGILTRQLASRCSRLLAVDVAEKALAQARRRCEDFINVRVARMEVPAQFPPGRFDLIVLSEVGYYWDRPDLKRAAEEILSHLDPAGHLLLVHWTPAVPDYPLTGDEVHEYFCNLPELYSIATRKQPQYRLDVLEKRVQSRTA